MRNTSNVRGHRGAFTLVEILMVVIIIGIAGAIIVPQMGARDDMRAAAAARIVMADLIYTQNLSITLQKNHYVRFDVTNGSYTVLASPAMTTVTQPVEKRPFTMTFGAAGTPGLRDSTLNAASFTGLTATPYLTIGFDELGTPLVYTDAGTSETMAGGSITVRSGTYSLVITIEPYTGQINVEPAP